MHPPKRSARPAARRVATALLVACVATPLLAACSSAGKTTCDEYTAMDNAARQKIEASLLSEHDLKIIDVANSVGVTQAIDSFCGVADNILGNDFPGSTAATQNGGSPIDDAADWSSGTW